MICIPFSNYTYPYSVYRTLNREGNYETSCTWKYHEIQNIVSHAVYAVLHHPLHGGHVAHEGGQARGQAPHHQQQETQVHCQSKYKSIFLTSPMSMPIKKKHGGFIFLGGNDGVTE